MSIKEVTTRSISRGLLLARKYSPEILTGVGIVGGVAAAVMGAKATLKVEPVVDKMQAGLSAVHEMKAEEDSDYTQKEYIRDLGYIYGNGAIDLVKLYGPAVSLGVASIGCVLGAHGIMRKRNAALVVAYNALEKSFTHYRDRVREALGEDKERDIRLGFVDSEVVDEETGKKKLVTDIKDPSDYSIYARFFDQLSQYWSKNPEYNLMFVRTQQQYANDLLKSRGHVFLNEVYESLGIPHTKEGAVVGWIYNGGAGDDFIDFGIYDIHSEKAREFVNGVESAILLDFNVDGLIYDKI